MKKRVKDYEGRYKYSEKQIRRVCELLQEGYKLSDVARITGVERGTISNLIHRNDAWSYIKSQYNIPDNCSRTARNNNTIYSDEKIEEVCQEIMKDRPLSDIANSTEVPVSLVWKLKRKVLCKNITQKYDFESVENKRDFVDFSSRLEDREKMVQMYQLGYTNKREVLALLDIPLNGANERLAYRVWHKFLKEQKNNEK